MKDFPITIDPDVTSTPNAIRSSKLFNKWLSSLDKGWRIDAVRVRYANSWGGSIKMIYLQAEIYDADGNELPGVVFLRGSTTDILTIVSDGTTKFAVLVEQPRVPVGGNVTSNPSGMVESGDLQSDALRELAEEVGAEGIDWGGPICLNTRLTGSPIPFAVSPGGTDEDVVFFAVEGTISPEQFTRLQGRQAGLTNEHEQTTVRLVPLEQVPTYLAQTGRPDLKALMSWLLYQTCGQ